MMISRNRFQGDRRGFTLIELLVVVAIIALLISILLPSLDRARRQARQLVCATNLKSQHSAALLYAADNEDYFPRGQLGTSWYETQQGLYPGYNSYSTALLTYLGWSGNKNMKIKANQIVDVPADSMNLWHIPGRKPSSFGSSAWRVRFNVLALMEQYQCPDFPDFELKSAADGIMQWNPNETAFALADMPLDYVVSAIPIPYHENNYNYDMSGGNMEFTFWQPPEPVDIEDPESNGVITIHRSRMEDMPAGVTPADYMYVTEAHYWLATAEDNGLLFHTFFNGSMLPFAKYPRMAPDSRHPSGLNAMFFDGHVETMEMHEIDPATDASNFDEYCRRMKHLTYIPESFR